MHDTPGAAGLAFSGGGVIALLASMCQLAALQELVPNITAFEIGATSGGITGAVLMASTNSGSDLTFPSSWSPSSYGANASTLLSQKLRNGSAPWFAAVTDVLEPLSASPDRTGLSDWWQTVLGALTRLYGLSPSDLRGYPTLSATTSLLRKSAAPLKRDPSNVLINASHDLIPAIWRPADGMLTPMGSGAVDGPAPQPTPSTLRAISDATPFWAASLLESASLDKLLGGLIPSLPPPNDGYLLLDGGTVDTTAISALLRRGVTSIVAFYDSQKPLHDASAALGFLFGVPNTTTDLGMWEGPQLAQVFPTPLWKAVHANVTNPELRSARLENVDVLPNAYLGVEGGYQLSTLLIIATQRSEAFLREFDAVDPRVKQGLHPGWPEAMPLPGMTPLDANTLCIYSGWEVMRAREQIQSLFGVAPS